MFLVKTFSNQDPVLIFLLDIVILENYCFDYYAYNYISNPTFCHM